MVNTRDQYQGLFDIYWPIGVGVFVLIAVLVGFIVIRFRSDSDEFPEGRNSSKPAEGLYAFLLVCVAAALVYFTFSTMSEMDPATSPSGAAASEDALRIDVTAGKWNWRFAYPEQDVVEIGTDERPPTLVVPAETPVEFTLSSIDVIHSFWIPDLRFKRDAFPERDTRFALTFTDVGFHQGGGECAEYCGLRHSYMDFNVDVKEAEDFEGWVAAHQELDGRSTDATATVAP